jgi:hypothetical protein
VADEGGGVAAGDGVADLGVDEVGEPLMGGLASDAFHAEQSSAYSDGILEERVGDIHDTLPQTLAVMVLQA